MSLSNMVTSTLGNNALGGKSSSSALQSARNSSVVLDDASLFASLENMLTGNLDYRRAVEAATRAERVSALEAETTRQWQERLSSTAYSRAIADLKKNGINPYAIGSFSPASTPGGATGSAYNSGAHSAASSTVSALGFFNSAFQNYRSNMLNIVRVLLPFLL